LADAVQYEARHHVPFDLNELAWDFQVVETPDGPHDALKELDVMVIAVKRAQLKPRLGWFSNFGLQVDIVQTDSLALHNFLTYDHNVEENGKRDAGAGGGGLDLVLDVGTDATNIVVGSRRFFWSRSSRIGGHTFSKGLVREFNLTMAQAEHLKRDPAGAERLSDVYRILDPVFEEFAAEIEMALAAFKKSHPGAGVRQMLGLGGGFRLHGLLRYLRTGR